MGGLDSFLSSVLWLNVSRWRRMQENKTNGIHKWRIFGLHLLVRIKIKLSLDTDTAHIGLDLISRDGLPGSALRLSLHHPCRRIELECVCLLTPFSTPMAPGSIPSFTGVLQSPQTVSFNQLFNPLEAVTSNASFFIPKYLSISTVSRLKPG